jgi:16S rRNA (guanine(1405)-N(7))-methyltransferase
MDILSILVQDIKKKKELAGIEDSVVRKWLNDYFRKNKTFAVLREYQTEKQLKKSDGYKKALKKVRAELHSSYGMFQIPGNADEIKKEFLKKAKMNSLSEPDYKAALSLHLSTKERLQSYPMVYEKIFKETGKPKVILDLGCGLNPLSWYYMPVKNFKYIASDIDLASLKFIGQYFDLAGINGETLVLDLQNNEELEKLSKIQADVCFLFKVLEIDKRIAEPIFRKVNSKFIVVSFSTLSISGKIMSHSEREWFEKMLSRLNLSFSVFQTENEIFYIVKK